MSEHTHADGAVPEWERYSFRERLLRYCALLGAFVVFAISWRLLNVRYEFVSTAARELEDLFVRMFPPDVRYTTEIVSPLIETIHIAILGTILAICISIPVAYIAAENTTPNRLTYALGKFIISFTRSVNVIIWALVFVVVFGPTALAGVWAVAVRSIGFLGKLLSEEIEEIEPTTVEAVSATGANGAQTLIYGVVPQILPAFIGIATYRWDINVRESTVIGFVGAGGIGTALLTQIDFFEWSAVATILLAILGAVVLSEAVSAYLRSRVR